MLRRGSRSRYYLDKYRFETRPDLLRAIGERLAAPVRRARAGRDADRRARARRRRARAAASLESGLPFLIVRKEAKGYGTDNRLEGVFEPGEQVCLVEDVVTSGGAAVSAVEALRDAGLSCCQRDMRRRPRRGGCGRARAARRAPAALCSPPPTSCRVPKCSAKAAWLSGSRLVARVRRLGPRQSRQEDP